MREKDGRLTGLLLHTEVPDVRVIAVVEPDSLANLVTNLNVQKCANAKTTYLNCVNYALTNLAKAGVFMYMDAGHAGECRKSQLRHAKIDSLLQDGSAGPLT